MRSSSRGLLQLRHALVVLFGSAIPVLTNAALLTPCPYRGDLDLPFSKPWFLTAVLFLGTLSAALPSLIAHRIRPDPQFAISHDLHVFRRLAIPSLCATVSMALSTRALLSVPPAVWQSFSGFRLLFSLLLASTLNGRPLLLRDWGGLCLVVAGIGASGSAAIARASTHASALDALTSSLLLIAAQAIAALQEALEARLLPANSANRATVVAFEALWGFLATALLLLPVAAILPPASGPYEDAGEAARLLGRSAEAALLTAAAAVCAGAHAFLGIALPAGSGWWAAAQPLCVWALAAAARYGSGRAGVGETADRYAVAEIAGFAVALLGTAVFAPPDCAPPQPRDSLNEVLLETEDA